MNLTTPDLGTNILSMLPVNFKQRSAMLRMRQRFVLITLGLVLLAQSVSAGWEDMPLELFPADPESVALPILVVHYSGDAGFNVPDKGFAHSYAANGIPVVGVNSLAYFITARTPQSAGADLADIILHFSSLWKTSYCVVSGYSFGADAVTYIVANLPEEIRKKVMLVICTSPAFYADFKFHVTSWMGVASTREFPVVDSIVALNHTIPVVCFYGKDDSGSSGPVLNNSLVETHQLSTGHRIGGEYKTVFNILLPRILHYLQNKPLPGSNTPGR